MRKIWGIDENIMLMAIDTYHFLCEVFNFNVVHLSLL